MGKKGKKKRTKSSESDSDLNSSKVVKLQDGRYHKRPDLNTSVSEILSEANSTLYEDIEYPDPVVREETGTDFSVFSVEKETSRNSQIRTENTKSSSSGSEIERPYTMAQKMVSSDSEKLDLLLASVGELKTSQDNMFESKLDKMRNDLTENINLKVKSLRDEIAMDLSRESGRIDEMLKSIQSLQGRMAEIEQFSGGRGYEESNNGMQKDNGERNGVTSRVTPRQSDDTDMSIIITGLPFEENENLLQKTQNVLAALGETVSSVVTITNTHRFRPRFEGKPGIVKVGFSTVEDKILTLRNKMKLKQSERYSTVYIRSSKSRTERLMEQNTRAILRNLPHGHNLRLNANGRIMSNTTNRQNAENNS